MHVNFLEAHGHERLCSNTLSMLVYASQILSQCSSTHRYASQILSQCSSTHNPFSYVPSLYIQQHKVPHPFTPRIQTLTRTLINMLYATHTLYARPHSQLFCTHVIHTVFWLDPTARPLVYTGLYTLCAYTVINVLAIGPLVSCYGILYGIKMVLSVIRSVTCCFGFQSLVGTLHC